LTLLIHCDYNKKELTKRVQIRIYPASSIDSAWCRTFKKRL